MRNKYGLKDYKIWNLEIKKVVYSLDVLFREIKDFFKQEVLARDKKPKKIELELKDDKSCFIEEWE